MSTTKNIPDFFIVGAPKCGTTALDYFLSLHPEIFMAKKELHYFGNDLGMRHGKLNEAQYLDHFSGSNQPIKGESSVWYLYSQKAAEEIKAFNPHAKIIIMLRRPDEMIPSLHRQYLYDADIAETDFEIAFEQDLKRSNESVASYNFENRPQFIDAASYYHQVKRYLDTFNPDQVLILLHDDFIDHFEESYLRVTNFLGTSSDFIPEKKQVNTGKAIKNVSLHHLSKEPPKGLKKIFRLLVPYKALRHQIMQKVEDLNVNEQQVKPLSSELKKKINDLIKEDVLLLEQLIIKDLGHWLT